MARLSLGRVRRQKNALARFKMVASLSQKQTLEQRAQELENLKANIAHRR